MIVKEYKSRYKLVSEEKADGIVYTPKILSDFVARQISDFYLSKLKAKEELRFLDPAVGDGELLLGLLRKFNTNFSGKINVFGFDTNRKALETAHRRIATNFPEVNIHFEQSNFLEFVLQYYQVNSELDLFTNSAKKEKFDCIIANPPYVRTQILGAEQSQLLSKKFNLNGRVDLYHPFLIAMGCVLKSDGIAGVIVSNRFMTTKTGASIRSSIIENFEIIHVWDLGDTKLFEAAVLPAVLLLGGNKRENNLNKPKFTSIYAIQAKADYKAKNPIEALDLEGIVNTNGNTFKVQHGYLKIKDINDKVWSLLNSEKSSWLSTVKANQWNTFSKIGKIRVGVKTTADKIFISDDWDKMDKDEQPELLKPITTHHLARRFKPKNFLKNRKILYTHEVINGKRVPINLDNYPKTKKYLEKHRDRLEDRNYVLNAGRKWFEIWVPHDPDKWKFPKLIFRDISKKPIFWIDKDGTVVNGDCYWIINDEDTQTDLLWLGAAVANSTFMEKFYDLNFNNKLYAGRRRFLTQYVEHFPLPDPLRSISKEIIQVSKHIYKNIDNENIDVDLENVNHLVWKSFGFATEEI